MKHVVIISDGVLSKRLSAVEMARRLRDSGYRITLVGPGGDYKEIDGIEYIRIDLKLSVPAASFSGLWPGVGGFRSLLAARADRFSRRDAIVKAVDIEAYREILRELSPDLLLIDVEAHSHIIPAINLPIPVAIFSVFFNLFRGSEAPPLNSDVIPGLSWRGSRLAINFLWIRFRLWKWALYRHQSIRYCGVDQLSLLKHYVNICGINWQDWLDCSHWLIPFVYKRLPMLILNIKEMDFLPRLRLPTYYVGPMVCTNRTELPFLPENVPMPSSLHKLLDEHRRGPSSRRSLVYCGFGSFFDGDLKFLKNIIASSIGSDWDLIIALGGRLETKTLGSLPDNVHCLRFAPQLEILAAADAAIIHGGLTTVYECIHHRVPMIVYPFTGIDQLGTAARVAKSGLGIVGSRSNDQAHDIRSHIETVLIDKKLKERMEGIRNHLIHHQDENTVANIVGQLITGQMNDITSN